MKLNYSQEVMEFIKNSVMSLNEVRKFYSNQDAPPIYYINDENLKLIGYVLEDDFQKIKEKTIDLNDDLSYVKIDAKEDIIYSYNYKDGVLREHSTISTKDGMKYYYYDENGLLHNKDNLPAFSSIKNNEPRVEKWYSHGELHRDNHPAIVIGNISKEWYQNGQRHNEWGPAIINGEVEKYFLNDEEFDKKSHTEEASLRRMRKNNPNYSLK